MVLTVAEKAGSIQSSQGSNLSLSSQKGVTQLGAGKNLQTFETAAGNLEHPRNKALQNEPNLMMTPTRVQEKPFGQPISYGEYLKQQFKIQ